MQTRKFRSAGALVVCLTGLLLPVTAYAWEPDAKGLDAAIRSGDFAAYLEKISAWLDQKTPADPAHITKPAMTALIKDPLFRKTLDQRQFILTHGVNDFSAFAKVEAHKPFLAWIMNSTRIMDLYLEADTPLGDQPSDVNEFHIDTGALDRWFKIYTEDPDSKDGIYLRMAMAIAIWPPGGTGYGSGLPIEWFARYKNYKTAHQRKELVPSFDRLPVCDLGLVFHSWGSDRDLEWGRQIFRSWRPDLLKDEQIPRIVSEVWRRFSPFPFSNGFVTVMEGGGKCGPRGFFGCFICQANGIPAIGVGQPQHCCFAAKSAYPELEPQPGSVWKVWQGRGWQYSDCGGCGGPQFLADKTKRYRVAELSQIAHLRWVALAVSSKERSAAVRAVAATIRVPVNTTHPLGVPAKDIDPIAWGPPENAAWRPEPPKEEPLKLAPGVIHVKAETFIDSFAEPKFPNEQEGRVYVYDSYSGGKQVNFARNMKISWVDYAIDVPETGTYAMEIMVAAANRDQVLDVSCGGEKLGTIKIPGTIGLWKKMDPVDIKLNKGRQTLRISAPLESPRREEGSSGFGCKGGSKRAS